MTEAPHGTTARYLVLGCRCAQCTAAFDETRRQQRATRTAKRRRYRPASEPEPGAT